MVQNSAAWQAVLDGVRLSGGRASTGIGCLTQAPQGLGVAPIRTEDVVYPQRDGVKHFSDWYDPRIITLEDVWVCNDTCPGCPSGRAKVRQITNAWSRRCDDAELVIFTDCPPAEAASGRADTGPYAAIGRPRVAEVTHFPTAGCSSLLLRFDAVDQRLYILDAAGTPGSGVVTTTLFPDVGPSFCRTYPRCYPLCYTEPVTGGSGPVEPSVVNNYGNVCGYPTITLFGLLTDPVIENTDTGETIGYRGTIDAAGLPVVIDTYNGTASQGNASRTNLLTGTTRWQIPTGESTIRLVSAGAGDDGYAVVSFRPAMDAA